MNSNLLDYIKKEKGFKRDVQLSRYYGVTAPVISKIRNEKLPFGSGLIVVISEDLNMPTREIFKLINRHRVAAAALARLEDSGEINRMIGKAENMKASFETMVNSTIGQRKIDQIINSDEGWKDEEIVSDVSTRPEIESNNTRQELTEEQWRRNIWKKARM